MNAERIRTHGEAKATVASDGQVTLSVPIRIKRRSGRKLVSLPEGVTSDAQRPWDSSATPLQLALARGFRWLRMLESGEVASMSEVARREGVDPSYVARMVNLTTLAPDIIAAVLDDMLPNSASLTDVAINPPHLWGKQKKKVAL